MHTCVPTTQLKKVNVNSMLEASLHPPPPDNHYPPFIHPLALPYGFSNDGLTPVSSTA